jgi:hypothetical protein
MRLLRRPRLWSVVLGLRLYQPGIGPSNSFRPDVILMHPDQPRIAQSGYIVCTTGSNVVLQA